MRRIFPIMVFASLLLSACQASTPQATVQPSATPEPTTAATTATKAATHTPVSEATASSMELTAGSSPGCTVQSPFPTPGPTEQALLPPTGVNDWVAGSESAQITFTEYSDFQ